MSNNSRPSICLVEVLLSARSANVDDIRTAMPSLRSLWTFFSSNENHMQCSYSAVGELMYVISISVFLFARDGNLSFPIIANRFIEPP